MKPILVAAVLLASALPAVAQSSKVYTNADLTSKPVTWSRTVTPEELAGLQARAFSAPLPPGPTVYVAPWAGDGPSGFPADHNERLMAGSRASFDPDDLWRDPVTAFAVQHPIEAAYGFRHAYGASSTRPASVRPSTPRATPPTPPIMTSPASAGRRVR